MARAAWIAFDMLIQSNRRHHSNAAFSPGGIKLSQCPALVTFFW
jgi:hypothetical protein